MDLATSNEIFLQHEVGNAEEIVGAMYAAVALSTFYLNESVNTLPIVWSQSGANLNDEDDAMQAVLDLYTPFALLYENINTLSAEDLMVLAEDPTFDNPEAARLLGCAVQHQIDATCNEVGGINGLVDFIPGLGDIKGVVDALTACAETGVITATCGAMSAAAIIGFAGPIGDGAGKLIKSGAKNADEALDVVDEAVAGRIRSADYTPTTIGGREYSSHALQRMDERGLTPSVVENTVDDGFLVGQGNRPNTLVYYDPINRVQVITNFLGDVVTVIPGNGPKLGALAPLGD